MPAQIKDELIPIALFAYKRTIHLKRTIEGLKINKVPLIYAFIDGPKTKEDIPRVEEVKQIIDEINWCEVKKFPQDVNLGLGTSIRKGVTRTFDDYDKIIVIEDDIVMRPGAYKYACQALFFYEKYPEVMTVSLWNHPVMVPKGNNSGFFSERFMCWGWGTYKKYWVKYNSSILDIYESLDEKQINKIKEYSIDLLNQVEYSKKSNIWFVGYAMLHFKLKKISFYPKETLVVNIGKDSTAENDGPGHTSYLENLKLIDRPIRNSDYEFPQPYLTKDIKRNFNKYFYLRHPFHIRKYRLLKKKLYFLYKPFKDLVKKGRQ